MAMLKAIGVEQALEGCMREAHWRHKRSSDGQPVQQIALELGEL